MRKPRNMSSILPWCILYWFQIITFEKKSLSPFHLGHEVIFEVTAQYFIKLGTLEYLIITHCAFIYFQEKPCPARLLALNSTITALCVYLFLEKTLPCALIPYCAIIRYSRVCTLMLRWYLSRLLHFCSDWLWPYYDWGHFYRNYDNIGRGQVDFFKNYIFEISASSWERWGCRGFLVKPLTKLIRSIKEVCIMNGLYQT